MTFAETYNDLLEHMLHCISCSTHISCRGQQMAKEVTGEHAVIGMPRNGVSVFSHKDSRVVPIRFILAELCYLLSGSNDLELMASYSAAMRHYSNDGKTISGAYGYRLKHQFHTMLSRLLADPSTRQACGAIFSEEDGITAVTHIPCNVFLQLLLRDNLLSLYVTSRSSDFVTGFSIDTIHWQMLLRMFARELRAVPEQVVYNIASLHIYKQDMPIVNAWSIGTPKHEYEWILRTDIKFLRAIERCIGYFKAGMSVTELADLLEFDDDSIKKIVELDVLFRLHRNKLER